MIEDRAFDDRQAESHAACFRGAEWRENFIAQIGSNAAAIVLYCHNYAIVDSPFRTDLTASVTRP